MTEPKVVRYKIHAEQYEQKSASGLWVRYSDYEALAARVEELEAARNRHLKQARSLAKTLKDTSVSEYAAKLEAENKRLREIVRRLPHRDDCRMVTAKLLTGDDSDCDCGAALKEKP